MSKNMGAAIFIAAPMFFLTVISDQRTQKHFKLLRSCCRQMADCVLIDTISAPRSKLHCLRAWL